MEDIDKIQKLVEFAWYIYSFGVISGVSISIGLAMIIFYRKT